MKKEGSGGGRKIFFILLGSCREEDCTSQNGTARAYLRTKMETEWLSQRFHDEAISIETLMASA